jgi:PAS domain S-box-containing protein
MKEIDRSSKEMNQANRKTILLVEDEALIAMDEANTIKKFGYDVLTATNGQKAIDIARQNPDIDLILMDIDLGSGMDGTEAAKIILAFREVPIVFLTSHSEREMVEKVKGITRYGYLLKNSGDFVLRSSIEMAFELFDAHQKTKAEEQKYELIAQNTADVIWLMDLDLNLLYISPSIEKMTGYTQAEYLKLPFEQTMTPASLKKVYSYMQEEMELERRGEADPTKERKIELQELKNDGSVIWIEANISVLRDKDNIPIKLIGVSRDITERKMMESALRESEEKYRRFVETTNEGIWAVDNDFKTTYINTHMAKMLGYSKDEILNQPLSNFVFPEDMSVFQENIEICKQGKNRVYEQKFRHKKGRTIWVIISNSPIKEHDGRISGCFAMVTDITKMKQAEQREETVHHLLRTIQEINQMMIRANDAQTLIKMTCDLLISNRDYSHAYLIITDEDNNPTYYAQSGFENDIAIHTLPKCARVALSQPDIFFAKMDDELCSDCILDQQTVHPYIQVIKLQHNEVIYGVLAVSGKKELLDLNEEKDLLREVAGDIGYALHNLMYEQKRIDTDTTLKERVKELHSLYEIIKLSTKPNITISEVMQKVVELTTAAMQYPDITSARIVYADQIFKTANYQPTDWKINSDIMLDNLKRGFIEVNYLRKPPRSDKEAFLYEEQELLEAIAEHLSTLIQRKETLRLLHENKEFLEVMLDSIGDAMIATDREGKIIKMNPIAEELTGWNLSEAEGKKLSECFQIINAHTRKPAKNPVDKVMKSGKVEGLANDTILIAKNGKELQIADSAAPIENEEGQIYGVIMIFRDVSHEYKNRIRLQKSRDELFYREKELRTIVDNIPGIVGRVDKDLRYIFVSKGYETTFGKSRNEIIGKTMPEVLSELAYNNAKPYIDKALSGESVTFENSFYLPDGQNMVGLTTFIPDLDEQGKVQGLFIIGLDITERKQAELRLVEKEDQIRQIAESTDAVLWEYDIIIDRWTYVAPQVDKILGYKPDDWTNLQFWLDNLHPEDREWASEYCFACTKRGEKHRFEYRFRKKNGNYIWLRDVVNVEMQDEKPVKLRGIMIDISERKDAEIKLKKLLEEKVLLLKEVHHRIKNNMSTIISLLSIQAAALKNKSAISALQDAQARIKSMLLIYEKLFSTQNYLEIDVSNYISELVNQVASSYSYRDKITISKDIDQLIWQPKKAFPLGIIVNELLTNAYKHAFSNNMQGEIRISLKQKPDNNMELTISDNGVGLPDKREESNHSFGLDLISALVEQINGELEIKSDEGTSFRITFPSE